MPDPIFRVSQVDMFRAWEQDPESNSGWLLKALTSNEPTEDMLRGTAFHAALETIKVGEVDRIDSQGFTFLFDGDFTVPAAPVREVRLNKNYGGIVVSGKIDGLFGRHIIDHKAAMWFDAERYFKKYQWRYYLDIFKAEKFTWYVWEMQEHDQEPRTYTVRDLHVIEQYRYPELEQDCRALAHRLRDFASVHMKIQSKPDIEDALMVTEEDIRA